MKLIKHILPAAGLFLFLSSCEKEEINRLDEMKGTAKIIYVNATPNASAIPVQAVREIAIYPYYNGTTYNLYPIKFPWSNGYKHFEPGRLTMRLDTAQSQGNFQPGPAGKVMEFPLQLEADSYYSLYSVGNTDRVDTFFIKDDLSMPSSGKSKILFLNLSPDAGPVDIIDANTGARLASNLSYKQRNITSVRNVFSIVL